MNDELHKIAKDIVDDAERYNAIIAIGNLNGIRNNNKGKKVNRIVNSMPFHKLRKYIKYKALERDCGHRSSRIQHFEAMF